MAEDNVRKRFCFLVGPIGSDNSKERDQADWLFEEIVQPVMTEIGEFEVRRADQIATPGRIDAQIIGALLDADLVIADLSFHNPNAFYEIGIRHMAQKPIIHMQLADESTPFDVSLYRAIKFKLARPKEARDELKKQVNAVLEPGYEVDNPVTGARGHIKLLERATPKQMVLMDEIRAIKEQLYDVHALAIVTHHTVMNSIPSPTGSLFSRPGFGATETTASADTPLVLREETKNEKL